ncbi:unnamed protein product [Rotaria sp. Silwood1]|nr:unnamed protein product [Rotaria sp. Silwood1]CAF3569988.1 unnamed protein product [Rotaria sp. Silwood1]CAF3629674.1 unnamed protein product [Rotaria sp. Silwood1]CAF4655139.1 unnamed protein product [Rotaria sp. Silwood1]CAF4895630.1 unnamed protein product [Rotaria sp. Silwood1]
MANGYCTNELCVKRETQLRLALLREELLTNFNTLLIDRIRFLEQTINRLSLISPSTPASSLPTLTDTCMSLKPIEIDRLTPPSLLRRSSSAGASFLQSPIDPNLMESGAGARSCPSSVDLSSQNESRKRFLSIEKPPRTQDRTSFEYNTTSLSIPIYRHWASSADDLQSSAMANSEKGRLESRRFACDVDDNDVRAFKAMIYMEQARKQHTRPLTRLRQALGISSNSTLGSSTSNSSKKQTNF